MDATLLENLNSTMTAGLTGTVAETVGMTVTVADFPAPVGAVVNVERDGDTACDGEVVGFREATRSFICSRRRRACDAVSVCEWCELAVR
jgi:hypothetical protein